MNTKPIKENLYDDRYEINDYKIKDLTNKENLTNYNKLNDDLVKNNQNSQNINKYENNDSLNTNVLNDISKKLQHEKNQKNDLPHS